MLKSRILPFESCAVRCVAGVHPRRECDVCVRVVRGAAAADERRGERFRLGRIFAHWVSLPPSHIPAPDPAHRVFYIPVAH